MGGESVGGVGVLSMVEGEPVVSMPQLPRRAPMPRVLSKSPQSLLNVCEKKKRVVLNL
jgi:hypothetical protein